MFRVGDKVVHPAHGAGMVAALDRRDLCGDVVRYYVIELANSGVRLYVPVDSAEAVGLRPVAGASEMREALEALAGRAHDLPAEFKRRQVELHERLRSGTAVEVAAVLRDMRARQRERSQSPTEARLFQQARVLLGSEVALYEGTDVEAALGRIDGLLDAVDPSDDETSARPEL